MKKWGLGIEHEMRIRFNNNISDLPKIVRERLFSKDNNNKYIFIDSNSLLYYFKFYEVPLMKNFKKYINLDEEKKYFDIILIKLELIEMARNKTPFPIYNKKYFDFSSNETKKIGIEFFEYYLNIYALYNAPLLYYKYNIDNNLLMSLDNFMSLDYIKRSIYNEPDNIIDFINDKLENLYNDQYEKDIYDYIKQLFKKKNVNTFYFYSDSSSKQYINFIYGNSVNSNISIDKFISKLDYNINKFKNIIETNLQISSLEDYKIYKNLYILYSNNIPHIDYSSKTTAIEFKTIKYENLNYEEGLKDLIELEKTFFYIINNIPILKDLTDMFGELMYHNIGSVDKSVSILSVFDLDNYYENINEDYTGSYHIWLTAPYTANMPMTKFLHIHSTLANKLQLLEPIFCAHFSSPSYNAFNESNMQSKASLRQFLNAYSNYGTSDVSLMNGTKKKFIDYYYLSEDDIINKKRMSRISNSRGTFTQKSIYDIHGKLLINYNKLDTRSVTNNIYSILAQGNTESNQNININNYFSMVFEKSDIRPKSLSYYNDYIYRYLELGADIRTRPFNDYFYPLDPEWSRCLLMKHNRLTEVYYNEKQRKISYERVYNKEKHYELLNNRIGIEFRILDHFPTSYLNQILSILVPLVLDSAKNPKIIKFKNTSVSKQFWHDEMFNVITKGYEYTLSNKYINAIEKEFNIVIEHKKNIHSHDILRELYEKLSKKYSRTHKNSLYNKMKFNSDINFFSFNKKAWFEILNRYFESNPQQLRRILYFNKDLSNNNLLEIIGKKYNYDLEKIKNYIKNIGNVK
jgi:hypothetical protein